MSAWPGSPEHARAQQAERLAWARLAALADAADEDVPGKGRHVRAAELIEARLDELEAMRARARAILDEPPPVTSSTGAAVAFAARRMAAREILGE